MITCAGQSTLQDSLQKEASAFFTTGAASGDEDAARARRRASERAKRYPHPTKPSSHPKAGAGKAAPASQAAGEGGGRAQGRAAAPSHPAAGSEQLPPHGGQSLRSIAGMRQAASTGPHPARRARAVIHTPPSFAMSHRCPCAATDPAAAETMSVMLAGSRGGRGNQIPPFSHPRAGRRSGETLSAVGGPQP